MNYQDIVIGEAEYTRINDCLKSFLRESQGKCAILVDRDGQMLAKQGFTQNLDTVSLSALTAGAIASTQEIARLLGEPEFSVLFHQGTHDHIHFSLVGSRAILMSVFDDRTTIGLIRLVAAQSVDALASLLEAPHLPPLNFGDDMHGTVAAELDRVLGVEK
ncbi:MAG TPA: roadblock/LC7 domain-containing protein [Armatimonadota bacterium]|jgi:predicted regulator of Ras-like GTPase activity (Roadblock/LC7/MglB family)